MGCCWSLNQQYGYIDPSDSDSSVSESKSEDSKESAKDSKKRKTDENVFTTPKKTNTEDPAAGASTNLFVRNLSWKLWAVRDWKLYNIL